MIEMLLEGESAELEVGLLATAQFETSSLFLAVAYDSEEQRNNAARRLDGLTVDVLGGRLTVDWMEFYPSCRQPSELGHRAIERLVDRARPAPERQEREDVDPGSHDTSVASWMESRVDVVKTFRSLLREEQLPAFDLLRSWGLAWGRNDDGGRHIEVSIRNGPEAVLRIPGSVLDQLVHGLMIDPFAAHRLREVLDLPPRAEVSHIVVGGSRAYRDAVALQLEDVRDSARRYNKLQPRISMTLEEEELNRRLAEAFYEERHMCATLGLLADLNHVPDATSRLVLIATGRPRSGWVPGGLGVLYRADFPSEDGKDRISVVLTPGEEDETGHARVADPGAFFDVDWNEALSWSYSDLWIGLARELGFLQTDLLLVWRPATGELSSGERLDPDDHGPALRIRG